MLEIKFNPERILQLTEKNEATASLTSVKIEQFERKLDIREQKGREITPKKKGQ